MKKQILLAILAFMMILISSDAYISSSAQGTQNISVTDIQDTSKVSKSEKNQNIIINNQKILLQNQEVSLKNQDTIKKNLTNSTQQIINDNKNIPGLILQQVIYNNNKSIYNQLEKTQQTLKIQQKQIDSLIVIKRK